MEAAELAELIRERTKSGELLASADLEAAIADRHIPVSGGATEPPDIPALIREAMISHPDIQMIPDDSGGAWYFSEQSMTVAYARLQLLKGRGPLGMMAEVIREHSRVYPRPVPLALFRCAPFSLSDDDIALCLKEMTGLLPYRDIAHLTTSIGNLYAYSTDHLEPGHAAMLAEWADVGQVENP
ncbi:hypothetical protein Sfum_1081 [Syntrophobacter fumaroxidans MPOB]|uniref:Uncharacterized protein n=2 Tax=Syntrophobacter TaxID=29526 RepID=A0LH73_SYNFM|nr:hypothetical protein Sfum_1081 [Syntrophobacter fumaroxidans MPOB]